MLALSQDYCYCLDDTVAVTRLDGQSRPTEVLPNRHLQVHYNQKVAKYGHIAEQNRFQFIPAIFSHTGQIDAAFKDLLGEQIRHKFIAFEGQAKPSKINSVMKWWSKCISMVIAKTKTASMRLSWVTQTLSINLKF